MSHKDQKVLAESIIREPFIHSLVEQPCIDESVFGFSVAVYQCIKFIGGPFTKANTSAPETPITEPSTLANPCNCFMLMLSILDKQNQFILSIN